MTVAFTGHRPDKIHPWTDDVCTVISSFLDETRPELVISGMAQGVDQYVAAICSSKKIPWIAAIPFPGQESGWPAPSREMYHRLLERAQDIVLVDDSYHPWSFQRRNEYMVDNCQLLAAVWDGSPGGTANCIRYADRVGRAVRYLDWR